MSKLSTCSNVRISKSPLEVNNILELPGQRKLRENVDYSSEVSGLTPQGYLMTPDERLT